MIAECQVNAAENTSNLERLCRFLSERSPQPLVAVEGVTHLIRYLNPAFCRLVGKESDELIGRTFADAVPEGVENQCLSVIDRVFQTGLPENLAEQEHFHPSPAYWSYAVWALLGEEGRPAGVMIQVINSTETVLFRRRAVAMNEALLVSSVKQHELLDTIKQGEEARHALEVQMFNAQKLESLGVLAGGIAHDLNNLLTPVLGYAELATRELP